MRSTAQSCTKRSSRPSIVIDDGRGKWLCGMGCLERVEQMPAVCWRLLERRDVSRPVPTPPTSFVLRSYSIVAEPCLAAISVLGFRSCWASHKLLQVGRDIRLKPKRWDLFVFRQCSYSYPSFRLKIPPSRIFQVSPLAYLCRRSYQTYSSSRPQIEGENLECKAI